MFQFGLCAYMLYPIFIQCSFFGIFGPFQSVFLYFCLVVFALAVVQWFGSIFIASS